MADYWTRFASRLPVGCRENIGPAFVIYRQLERDLDEEDGSEIGFQLAASPDRPELIITSEFDGSPEHVVTFGKRCGLSLGLTGRWGFAWGNSCSGVRIDGFGGGAHIIDLGSGETIGTVDCIAWLASWLAEDARLVPVVTE